LNLRLYAKLIFFFIIIFTIVNLSEGQNSKQNTTNYDSVYTALLIDHLKNNFDDIHDVSMRFHHMDHNLNGIIQIKMYWEKGRMTSSSVGINETNNKDFADALIQKFQKWYIKDLIGPFEISLPFRIKIIGSDDSTFSEKGILTGEIFSNDGEPLNNVRLGFRSVENPSDTLLNCISNREGIFVKTLIPVGNWDIDFFVSGFQKYSLNKVSFQKGNHIRERIILRPED